MDGIICVHEWKKSAWENTEQQEATLVEMNNRASVKMNERASVEMNERANVEMNN